MTVSVRELRIGEMISISAHWLDSKSIFLGIPEIAPHLDRLVAAHDALVAARDGSDADADLAELTGQAEVLDRRHDDLARALYYLLIAAHHYELGRDGGDESKADTIERACGALFPDQLRAVQASYQAEAGNAAQLDALASGEYATLLSNIHMAPNTSALDVAHAIGNIGRALGVVENQRSIAALEAKKEAITPKEVRSRMREWAQVVEAVLLNLELSAAPKESIDALRQPVLDTVAKAATRRKERRAAREKEHKPEGT